MYKREQGILKTYDLLKGWGFIQRKKGKDVFVRYVDFTCKDTDTSALIGTIVEFDVESTEKGFRAKNVQIIG
jgi:CspA family cold shock protein